MVRQVSLDVIQASLIANEVDGRQARVYVRHLLEQSASAQNLPNSEYQIDPRDGTVSIYSSARSKRVHTVKTSTVAADDGDNCPICNGQLTGVCHIEPLSQGHCFITENLYPVVHPRGMFVPISQNFSTTETADEAARGGNIFGGHFLQWTSSIHTQDWHNMSLDDLTLSVKQLALFSLRIHTESESMPQALGTRENTHGYMSIFKNYGEKGGASLTHGHQQIVFSNLMGRSSYNNWRFYGRHCEYFSDYMLRENSQDLKIKDYGDIVLMVPYFMHRPYTMLVIVKQTQKGYLHQLSDDEVTQFTQAIQHAIRAVRHELAADGKPIAFNFLLHTGPGCGLYAEIIPRADTFGGLELQGTYVCQAQPEDCALRIKKTIANDFSEEVF
ncbi:hypothetical protein [Echinimonas agarilytica]|uniref:Galactose-1-phosphate uridylyltransferase n=1 Tax=Echinimonas agarilytica TaxID=1215918 RepID=A0AA41W547_9GAMM|nr:hypothetical protein [Echinimonas agarilytica]MCM2678493.1 hypothetical protein [Echinimonas agarilytica]